MRNNGQTSARIKFAFTFVLALSSAVVGQSDLNNVPDEWFRIESPSKDFSIGVPSANFLVDNEDGSYRIIHPTAGFFYSVSVYPMRDAKDRFARSNDLFTDPKYKFFKSDNFWGRWYKEYFKETESHSYWFDLASNSGSFTISITAKKENQASADKILRSIRFDGKQVFDVKVVDPPISRTVPIQSLKTSDIVKTALDQPDPKGLIFEKEDEDAYKSQKLDFSRPLIILRKPKATYTERARDKKIEGMVRLRIYLRADGTIGAIKLLKSLAKDLDKHAFEAARGIKFIPAEINGKPVDSVVTFEYGYNIY